MHKEFWSPTHPPAKKKRKEKEKPSKANTKSWSVVVYTFNTSAREAEASGPMLLSGVNSRIARASEKDLVSKKPQTTTTKPTILS